MDEFKTACISINYIFMAYFFQKSILSAEVHLLLALKSIMYIYTCATYFKKLNSFTEL